MIANKNYKRIMLALFPLFGLITASFLEFYPYDTRLILFSLPCFIIIVSCFCLLLEKNRCTGVILSIFILYFASGKICLPPADFIYHRSYARGWYEQIISEDKINNTICFPSVSLCSYYAYPNQIPLLKAQNDFRALLAFEDKQKLNDMLIDRLNKGDIGFIYAPFRTTVKKNTGVQELREYLIKNKQVHIIYTLTPDYLKKDDYGSYLLKFVKL